MGKSKRAPRGKTAKQVKAHTTDWMQGVLEGARAFCDLTGKQDVNRGMDFSRWESTQEVFNLLKNLFQIFLVGLERNVSNPEGCHFFDIFWGSTEVGHIVNKSGMKIYKKNIKKTIQTQ